VIADIKQNLAKKIYATIFIVLQRVIQFQSEYIFGEKNVHIHIFLIWITSRVDLTVSVSPSVWPCKSSMSLDIRFRFLSFWFSASFLSECSMPIRRPTSLKLFHIFEDFVYHYPSMYNMAVQKRKFCSHPFTWLIKVFKKCIQKVKFFGWVLDLAKRPQSFFQNYSYDMYISYIFSQKDRFPLPFGQYEF